MGYTPVTLTYAPPKGFFNGTQGWNVEPVKVRWASGATSTAFPLALCPQWGHHQQYVFKRPTEAAGAEIDAQFALKRQRAVAAAAEAEAARQRALIDAVGAVEASLDAHDPTTPLDCADLGERFGGALRSHLQERSIRYWEGTSRKNVPQLMCLSPFHDTPTVLNEKSQYGQCAQPSG